MTNDTTSNTAAPLDLRPKKGSILYELLRLGLVFDHADNENSQTWADYTKNLRADFTNLDATTVTFTDLTTRLSTEITISDLVNITSIITWQSSQNGETA